MFGRRNPDHPPAPTSPSPLPATSDNDIDLDLLPDLPTILPATQGEPSPEPPPTDPAWHAGAWPPPAPPSLSELLSGPDAPSAATSTETAPSAEATPTAFQTLVVPPPASDIRAATDKAPAARTRPISESVIGPDDFFDGHYRSERGVRIQGTARGSIESRQYIFVEEGAEVEADLSAEDITVAGNFKGKIECRRRLEITGGGKVYGHVQTVLLVVHEGGVIDGELHMREADEHSTPS